MAGPSAHALASAVAAAPVVGVHVSAVAAVEPVRGALVLRHVRRAAVAAARVLPDVQLELHARAVLRAFVQLAQAVVARVARVGVELQPAPVLLAVRRVHAHARRVPGISGPLHDLTRCPRA